MNVLIGPNAVGKSNLIEAISLLKAAPTGTEGQILRGGGVRQWLCLGEADSIFWIAEMMESWFHADKDRLEEYYGSRFRMKADGQQAG